MNPEKYSGLNNYQVQESRQKYGKNLIQADKKKPIWLMVLGHFKSPIILILFFASVLSGYLGETRDAFIIVLMVILSVSLDFIQEYRADQASKKLSKKLSMLCTVLRNGHNEDINVSDLVIDDILVLNIGDIVPADAEILEIDSFLCNESMLTGESFAVEKKIGDRVFAGSNVTGGWAYCKVTAIGSETKFGHIAKKLSATDTKNPFAVGIDKFGLLILKVTTIIVTLIVLIILGKNWYTETPFSYLQLLEVFLFAVTIAVGLAPELLPVITSLNLARGSLHMNKVGVLVKKLNAIPDFGSMDILCTDKTGTLTEDKISLFEHLDANGNLSEKVFTLSYYNSHFQSGLKNSLDDAILNHEKGQQNSVKILTKPIENFVKLDEIPYDFKRRRLSVILKDGNNEAFICTKGQPDEIFNICTKFEVNGGIISDLNPENLSKIQELYKNLSLKGFRVLAVCYRSVKSDDKFEGPEALKSENDMIFSGLLAFLDPPKMSAKSALDKMVKYGLKVKILTGDNELVTSTVVNELGIELGSSEVSMLTGDKLDLLSEVELGNIVDQVTVFARVNPDQKQRIITSLQANGHIVGYMGDGINDSLSLKKADVGISVDNAVDIAKESADIILLEKNLGALVDGVIEGRKTFGNTQKYMFMSLSSNFGNMLSMTGAALFLPFLPMLPTQILFNNLLYDISQVGIPLDWVDQEYIEKPKKWDLGFIQKFMLIFGPISSLFDFLTFYIMYKVLNLSESAFQTAWFMESLATQILVIYIIRTRKLAFLQSIPGKYLIASTLTMLGIGLLIPFSFLGSYFGFVNIPQNALWVIFGLVLAYLCLMEIVKSWFYKRLSPAN